MKQQLFCIMLLFGSVCTAVQAMERKQDSDKKRTNNALNAFMKRNARNQDFERKKSHDEFVRSVRGTTNTQNAHNNDKAVENKLQATGGSSALAIAQSLMPVGRPDDGLGDAPMMRRETRDPIRDVFGISMDQVMSNKLQECARRGLGVDDQKLVSEERLLEYAPVAEFEDGSMGGFLRREPLLHMVSLSHSVQALIRSYLLENTIDVIRDFFPYLPLSYVEFVRNFEVYRERGMTVGGVRVNNLLRGDVAQLFLTLPDQVRERLLQKHPGMVAVPDVSKVAHLQEFIAYLKPLKPGLKMFVKGDDIRKFHALPKNIQDLILKEFKDQIIVFSPEAGRLINYLIEIAGKLPHNKRIVFAGFQAKQFEQFNAQEKEAIFDVLNRTHRPYVMKTVQAVRGEAKQQAEKNYARLDARLAARVQQCPENRTNELLFIQGEDAQLWYSLPLVLQEKLSKEYSFLVLEDMPMSQVMLPAGMRMFAGVQDEAVVPARVMPAGMMRMLERERDQAFEQTSGADKAYCAMVNIIKELNKDGVDYIILSDPRHVQLFKALPAVMQARLKATYPKLVILGEE